MLAARGTLTTTIRDLQRKEFRGVRATFYDERIAKYMLQLASLPYAWTNFLVVVDRIF